MVPVPVLCSGGEGVTEPMVESVMSCVDRCPGMDKTDGVLLRDAKPSRNEVSSCFAAVRHFYNTK